MSDDTAVWNADDATVFDDECPRCGKDSCDGTCAPATVNTVIMEGGKLTEITNRAEEALLAGAAPIYQRGGELVRPVKLDKATGEEPGELRREPGSTVLVPVLEPWLVERMGRALEWRVRRKDKVVAADPKAVYARTLLGRAGEWRFAVLRGVATAPTIARDGRVVEVPGFDAASGLLLDFEPGAFPPVPASPTKDDAAAAMAELLGPLRGFPFASDAARSVALSAMLTALIRASLRTAPMHGLDSPAAGTGKSMLAEMVGLLATGFRPPAMSQGKSEEEDEKRLSTVLHAGDAVIHVDNCERAITGDFLCSMLTQEVVQARILGLSERRVLPATALVLASGNNLTFAGDASRRAVVCRLDAKTERPDERKFDFDAQREVLSQRPTLVVAGLTVLRAYDIAGRPEKLKPMGSFEDWAWVRGALVWLGHADPAETREAILGNDPRKDDLVAVMELWKRAHGNERVDVAGIFKAEGDGAYALREKLVEVACRGAWSGKSVGWWLRRNRDRVVGGRCIRNLNDERMRASLWWLEDVSRQTEMSC